MHILLDLFLTFARIGLFTFGGGYAMIAIIENLCVEQKKWITHEEMMDMTVIAESTPGPIAINCATYVGYKQRGLWGAIAATLGIVLPSFLVIFIIAHFLDGFLAYPLVARAFSGIRAAVVALILSAMWKIAKKSLVDIFAFIIFLTVAVLSFFTDLSPVIFVIAAGACGLVLNLSGIRKVKEDKKK